jgi:transcriptional regulator with XRE-family HTH domain
MSPIREYRTTHGLTQADLSALTGVPRCDLSLVETGQLAMPRPLIDFFANHDPSVTEAQARYGKARMKLIREKVAA